MATGGDVAQLGVQVDFGALASDAAAARQGLLGVASASTEMGSALDRAVETLKNGIGYLGLGFGLLKASEAIKDAVTLASRYQELGVAMMQVGTSAGYTRGFLTQLQAALQTTGISMIASRQTIMQMIQGNMDLANATDLARVAQNAAVVANLDSSETFERVMHGIEAGSTIILRTVGLNVSFRQSYEALARTLGVHVADLTQQQQEQARVNAVLEAGAPLTGAYEAAMTTAGKQVLSMVRYAQDLKVRLGETFQPAYTTVVFGLAGMLKFLADNTGLVLAGLAALAAKGLMPAIAAMVSWGTTQAGTISALVTGKSVTMAHSAAIAEDAEMTRIAAVAKTQLEATTLANAAAGSVDALATGNLTLAKAAQAAAEDVAAAAALRNTEAIAANGFAARASAAAMGVLNGALALVGGPAGLVFMALAAAVGYAATQTSNATKVEQEYSDALSKTSAIAKDLEDNYVALEKARGHNVAPSGDDPLSKAKQALLVQQQIMAAQAEAAHPSDLGGGVQGGAGVAEEAAYGITAAYTAHNLTLVQAEEKLKALEAAYRGQHDVIDAALTDMRDLAALQDTVTALTDKNTHTQEAANIAKAQANFLSDKGTEAMLTDIENQAALLHALQTGGAVAEEAKRKEQEAVAKASAAYKEYAKSTKEAAVEQTSLQDIVAATDSQLADMATKAVGSGPTRGQSGGEWAEKYASVLSGLTGARSQARTYMGLAGGLGDLTSGVQSTTEAQGIDRRLDKMKLETTQQVALAAATLQGAAARRVEEDAIKAQNAANDLGEKASSPEKKRASTLSLALSQSQHAEALTTTTMGLKQSVTDSERQAAANAQGVVAGNAMVVTLKEEAAARSNMLGARREDIDLIRQEAAAKAEVTAATKIAALGESADQLHSLTVERQRGVVALHEEELNQRALNEARASGATGDLSTLTAQIRTAMAADDAAKALDLAVSEHITAQQSIKDKEDELAALQKGTAAYKEWQVVEAGVIAQRKAAAAGESPAAQIQAGADAMRSTQLTQQISSQQGLDKTAVKPFQTAIKDIQREMAGFFDTILSGGGSAFQKLWNNMRDLFLKAISEILASEIMGKFQALFKPGGASGSSAGGMSLPGSVGGGAPGANSSTSKDLFAGASGGFAGYGVGYGIGETVGGVGGVALGTLGGGATGAMMGAQMGGPAGAVIGGVTGAIAGMVGSIVGMGDAAHAAAEKLKQAKIDFGNALLSFTEAATGTGNDITAQIKKLDDQAGALYAIGKKSGFQTTNPDQTGLDNILKDAAMSPAQRQHMIDAAGGAGDRQKLRAMFAEADQIAQDLAQAKATLIANFTTGMSDKLLGITQGVGGDALALQQAKEEKAANIDNANSISDLTKRTAALTLANQLYAAEVQQITANYALAIQQRQVDQQNFETDLAARTAAASGNNELSASLRLQIQQTTELESAIQKWSQTNPELIAQLEQVQALERAYAAQQLQQKANDTKDSLAIRAAEAVGDTNKANALKLELQQTQELRQAMADWSQTNPELITQLQQVQALEKVKLQTDQQQALVNEQGSLAVRALNAQNLTQQASVLALQLQQTKELTQAVQEWGDSNPALIAQLKQVQLLELQNAEQNLTNTLTNTPTGYKVEGQVYSAAGSLPPPAAWNPYSNQTPQLPQQPGQYPTMSGGAGLVPPYIDPSTGQPFPSESVNGTGTGGGVVLQIQSGGVPITIMAGPGQDVGALVDSFIRELQRRAVAAFGSSTEAAHVLDTAKV